jgi:hypothetical protein
MQMRVRVLLGAIIGVMMTSLLGCGHYTCGVTFGNSTCASSGGGISQSGGNGNPTASAYVFAVDTGGTIDGYTLTTTASTFAPTSNYTGPAVPTSDEGSGMVVAQKKYLYASFPSTFQIFDFSISATGTLTALSGSPVGANYLSSAASNPGSMITNPAGTLLFVASGAGNQVYVYQIGSDGNLSAVGGSPFTVPFFPANLAIDGLGKYLYITENIGSHTGSQIAAYNIGSNGSLTAIAGSPFSYPMWEVQGDPSGKFLIGTSGKSVPFNGTDDDHLYVFGIQQSGSNAGAISQVSGSPFTTVYSPFSITIQPNSSGIYLYSFSINDTDTGYNPVEGFALNTSSGALSSVINSPFSGLSDGFWGQVDQSGAVLFVYGGVTNNGAVTTDIGALNIGTGGALTEPTSQLTLPTAGFWTVTDPQ